MYVGNTSWRACAVIVNKNVSHAGISAKLRDPFTIVTMRTEGVEWHTLHGTLGLASAHLPHSQRPDS
eukprot:12649571-Heterocapsa_arctica.AAC.1